MKAHGMQTGTRTCYWHNNQRASLAPLQASRAVEDLQRNLQEEQIIVEEKKAKTQVPGRWNRRPGAASNVNLTGCV